MPSREDIDIATEAALQPRSNIAHFSSFEKRNSRWMSSSLSMLYMVYITFIMIVGLEDHVAAYNL